MSATAIDEASETEPRVLEPGVASPSSGPAVDPRRDERLILLDGALFSVMQGAGELYIAAFVLAIGFSETASALLTTVPLLVGAVLQLAAPLFVRRVGSFRRWTAFCVTLQALSFLPLLAGAIGASLSPLVVFAAVALYWGAGMSSSPAWNTWVARLVPREDRARFFGLRTRFGQAALVVAFLSSGLLLQSADRSEVLSVFAAMLFLAVVCRLGCAVCLWNQSEPPGLGTEGRRVRLGETWSRFRSGGDVRLLSYLIVVQWAANISGPYFTPFMLRRLDFGYREFALLIGMSFVAKILTGPFFGRIAARHGTRHLLWIGGLSIVPISAGWLVSSNFYYLLALQFLAGTAWAAYELAQALVLMESVPEEDRTSLLAQYNAGHASATAIGSMLGAAVLYLLGANHFGYYAVFALSAVARFAALGLLASCQSDGHPRSERGRSLRSSPDLRLRLDPAVDAPVPTPGPNPAARRAA